MMNKGEQLEQRNAAKVALPFIVYHCILSILFVHHRKLHPYEKDHHHSIIAFPVLRDMGSIIKPRYLHVWNGTWSK